VSRAAEVTLPQVWGQYLAAQRPPLLPEIELLLIAGHVDLNARCAELLEGGYAPYWAFCWGSGQALARFVLDRPELVRGKTVADLGSGSGVVAIAAALAGATQVTAVDIDPQAQRAAARNAQRNGVPLAVADRLPQDYDVLFASDVLYESPLGDVLVTAAQAGRAVYLADPHRHGPPRFACRAVAEITARTHPDVDYPICTAFIYQLTPCASLIPVLGPTEPSATSDRRGD
jgi:predicted nicotinamide N-methyase